MSFFKKLFKTVNRFLGLKKSRQSSVPKRRKTKRKMSASDASTKRSTPKASKDVSKKIKTSRSQKIAQSLKAPPQDFSAAQSAQKVKQVKVGEITHYFDRIAVAVVRIDFGRIAKGDTVIIQGSRTGELRQKVSSMQVESIDVAVAKKGELIGLKVSKPVHVGDQVYLKRN